MGLLPGPSSLGLCTGVISWWFWLTGTEEELLTTRHAAPPNSVRGAIPTRIQVRKLRLKEAKPLILPHWPIIRDGDAKSHKGSLASQYEQMADVSQAAPREESQSLLPWSLGE